MIVAAQTMTGTKAEAQSSFGQYSGQERGEKRTTSTAKERSSEHTKLVNKTMVLAAQTVNSTRKGA